MSIKMIVELSSQRIHSDFTTKVVDISGQNLFSCYQCGMCSAGCPMSFAMDLLPSQIILSVQLGLEEDIFNSRIIWLCASCETCSTRCPRGVDISKVMEALRLITLRKNINYLESAMLSAEIVTELPQIALVSGFRKLTA